MEQQKQHKLHILSLLKKRNANERSFKEIINYSNKLLESLDFIQKETIHRKILSEKIESDSSEKILKPNESELLAKCYTLQKDLDECYMKISSYTEQIIELKNTIDDKNNLLSKQSASLKESQGRLENAEMHSQHYLKENSNLKMLLQDKTDECDVLNLAYSSLDNRKNDLEIELKNTKIQLEVLRTSELNLQTSLKTEIAKNSSSQAKKSPSMDNPPPPPPASTLPINSAWFASKVTLPDKTTHEFSAHDSEVNAVLWSNDGCIITAGADRKVKLWKLEEGEAQLLHSLRGCNSAILSADVSSDSSLLLCSSADFASRVWTIADFTIRHTLTGHSGRVTSSKFVGESNRIVSGSADETLKLWDLRQRVCLSTYSAHSQVNDVIIGPANSFISGHTDKKVRVWDSRSSGQAAQIEATGSVTSLDLSKDGTMFLTSEKSDKLKLYDFRNYKVLSSLRGNGFEISGCLTRAKLSPDDQYCCCGSRSGAVFVWNVTSGSMERELKGHRSSVVCCAWSGCGNYLVSGESAKKCIVWAKM